MQGGLVAVVIVVDVGRAGHVATTGAGAGVVAIINAIVVVVRTFCVKGRSWWTKIAGGARHVRGDEVRRVASRGRVVRADIVVVVALVLLAKAIVGPVVWVEPVEEERGKE
jgi:hypothetical protein